MKRPRPANDNARNAPQMLRSAFDVYRVANRGRWVGRVVARNANEAIEAAAVEFNANIKKLIAVRRRSFA